MGRYTIFYQVYDGANPAVGSLVINSVPTAPSISLSQDTMTLTERKDGSEGSSTTTSIDFGSLITIDDSGGTVLLSYRIYNQDTANSDNPIYNGLANERGDTSENTNGITLELD